MRSTTALGAIGARPVSGLVIDVCIAAAALGGSLALATMVRGADGFAHSGAGSLDPRGVVLVVLATAPVVFWRRAPLGVFTLTAAGSVALAGFDYSIGFPLGATAALYLLASSRNEARPWTGAHSAAAVALFAAYLASTAGAAGAFPGIELFHTGLAWTAAWFAGERARLRREQVAALQERAARVEREAERERMLAVAEERARIARDLHDSAGHAINVIAVRAGAARLRYRQDPDRALGALEAIEELARQSAGEIDQFVGALRDGGGREETVEPPPGLASLDTLVAQHVAAGLDVTIGTAGTPRPLGGSADQAAFRILQEALTNAARHGAGTARVELGFGEAGLEVTVTNPLPAGAAPSGGVGHGLVGMHERATLLGGILAAERAGQAFRVRAVLPYVGFRS